MGFLTKNDAQPATAIVEIVINLLLDHQEEQKQIIQDNAPFYHDENFLFNGNEGYPKVIKSVSLRDE